MKIIQIPFLLSFFLTAVSPQCISQEKNKGVFVISIECRGYDDVGKSFKFPKDSIFTNGRFVVQKVMRVDSLDSLGIISVKESLDRYFLIDLKKDLYKDIGKNLERVTENGPWEDLKGKELGFNFCYKWYENEAYNTEDIIFQGKNIKKITYIKEAGQIYEVYIQPNSSNNFSPVFFSSLEDKFNGAVLKIDITYPDRKGFATYLTEFVQLKDHEILEALDKVK